MRITLGLLLAALLGLPAWAQDEKVMPKGLPVNSADDDDEPHVAEAGQVLYFTRATKGKEFLRVALRKGAAWAAKTYEIESYVQDKGDIRGAYATAGTWPRFLYFGAKDAEGKNYDLFVAVQQDKGKAWTAPTPVMKVNSAEDETHPWLSDGGKSLYFSRKTKEGWKVFVSTRAGARGPQGWGEPADAGLPVGYHHATLTPDGKTMYLQGPLENDRWGLFAAKRAAKGWGKPEPLERLNSSEGKTGDRSPNLSRDGTLLYFASDRPGGKGGLDLYAVPVAKLGAK